MKTHKTLTEDAFKEWLETYSKASEENDPRASAELFSLDAEYYESPFDEPMIGREAIYQYWQVGAKNLRDKESTYEILAIRGNFGIARWQANFFNVNSGHHVELDCVFLAEFDEQQKCRRFREWWHSRSTRSAQDENSSFNPR